MPRHDLGGIGDSAGSLSALTEVSNGCVPDHEATVFIALHLWSQVLDRSIGRICSGHSRSLMRSTLSDTPG